MRVDTLPQGFVYSLRLLRFLLCLIVIILIMLYIAPKAY